MKNRNFKKSFAALPFLAVALLMGCSSAKDAPKLSCPQVGLIQDSASVTFLEGQQRAIRGRFGDFRGGCEISKTGSINFDVEFDFIGDKYAPAQAAAQHKFNYFVAILGPDEKVVAHQDFTTTVTFDKGPRGIQTEEHELHVPVDNIENAWRYMVVAGFSLTPEQLAYNKTENSQR